MVYYIFPRLVQYSKKSGNAHASKLHLVKLKWKERNNNHFTSSFSVVYFSPPLHYSRLSLSPFLTSSLANAPTPSPSRAVRPHSQTRTCGDFVRWVTGRILRKLRQYESKVDAKNFSCITPDSKVPILSKKILFCAKQFCWIYLLIKNPNNTSSLQPK